MKIRVTLRKIFFFSLLLCKTVSADNSHILAVHPYLSPQTVEQKFTLFANHLSKKMGVKIKIKVGSSYNEHIWYIGADKVDIAYMVPASYVALAALSGDFDAGAVKPVIFKACSTIMWQSCFVTFFL